MQPLGPYPGAHLGARISAYVDAALDDSERELARAHLLDCEQCAGQVRRQRHLKQRMNCLAMAAPPASLVAALADRTCVEQHVERVDQHRRVLMHAAVTVGSLCASLTVVGLVAGGSAPTTPSAPVVASTPRTTPSPLPAFMRSVGLGPAAAVDADRPAGSSVTPDATNASLFTLAPTMRDRQLGR
ncbi:MAG: zf-HC2 domain-containing protein [Actinomycetota bacterium]|nr:zf-HC2 domain-containing protein [Actinomycetota bacterium]